MCKHLSIVAALATVSLTAACGSDHPAAVEGNAADTGDAAGTDGASESNRDSGTALSMNACDDNLKTLDLGAGATVTLVKAFKKGDVVSLVSLAPPNTTKASADVCLVKIVVGPGHPGPPDAPSTSAGIGIEVWLPSSANWNGRYQALGGARWQGGPSFLSLTAIGSLPSDGPPGTVDAVINRFVTSTTDTGHTAVDTGAFAMNPDRSFNQTLFEDFAERSLHEMAQKAKALAKAYYGTPPKYSYWNGCSQGGRQGLMEAQRHPDDFDGVLAGAPGINWDRFQVASMWAQIVMQQDLGGRIAAAKLQAATAAANATCSTTLTGAVDGYISDPSACQYDPSTDNDLLCVADGGTNTTTSCLSLAEANAINKIWFGPTIDGTVPPPATNNGWNAGAALGENQLWYGMPRGTFLIGGPLFDGLAGDWLFSLAADHVALSLLDPSYATPTFKNATGNGTNQWKNISYAGTVSVPSVFAQSAQRFHDLIGTDSPDLSAFSASGKKLLMWHGTRDSIIFPQGSINYYESLVARVGGYTEAQRFARFYLAPGIDHCTAFGVTSINPPVPGGRWDPALMDVLQRWVENGEAPDQIAATSAAGVTPVRTRPWCLYPKRLKYVSGDVNTGNFTCE